MNETLVWLVGVPLAILFYSEFKATIDTWIAQATHGTQDAALVVEDTKPDRQQWLTKKDGTMFLIQTREFCGRIPRLRGGKEVTVPIYLLGGMDARHIHHEAKVALDCLRPANPEVVGGDEGAVWEICDSPREMTELQEQLAFTKKRLMTLQTERGQVEAPEDKMVKLSEKIKVINKNLRTSGFVPPGAKPGSMGSQIQGFEGGED